MLIQYKKDFEKTAMGLLSYLPDFKNLANLKDEMKLNESDNDFQLYLYRDDDSNIVGVIGTQNTEQFVIIRYLSLAPGYRDENTEKKILADLQDNSPKKKIAALPEYMYLLKLGSQKDEE